MQLRLFHLKLFWSWQRLRLQRVKKEAGWDDVWTLKD